MRSTRATVRAARRCGTIGALFVALAAAGAIYTYRYARVWTPLQKHYVTAYLATEGAGATCRDAALPSIHWHATGLGPNGAPDPILHLDSGNPFVAFPFGLIAHLGDLLGEINSSVPFGTPGPWPGP